MTDVAVQEPRTRISATAMEMSNSGQGGMPMPRSFGEVIAFADVMSRAKHGIPAHLRDNPGACLAVTMQALRWEMDPFAVAQKTYNVKDQVAYEAQVIAAVVNVRAGLKKRPSIEYKGAGPSRQCVVTGEFNDGQVATYESPRFDAITTKNSPLWKSDPDQQLGYYSVRSFARRHCPEVILGVYDRDEIEASTIRDVTPAGTGLRARLEAAATSTEGFSAAGVDAALNGDQIPDHDTDTGEVIEAEVSTGGDDTFPGDREPAGAGEAAGSEQAEAQDTDPAADPNLAIADKLIADLAFETKADLLTMQAGGKYRGFVAMMKVQHPDKAAEVEKAMQSALDAFG